ncbi:hypothetical protein ACOMHN_061864 [Nucella lapillus]
MAESLDDFLDGVLTQDVKKRFTVHAQLVTYLSDPLSSLKSDDLDRFVEGLSGWVSCSNYKVSVNGLEILCLMVDRMGEEFKPHITTVMPSVIDRLGDAKDQVREQAQQLLLKLMMPASSPQYVFERMSGAFTHKLWLVREGILVCLQNTINRYGARCLHLSKTVPAICRLLDDQSSQVREAGVVTLTEIYRHVGEKVRLDLSRKGIPALKLSQIFARFDEVKMSGNMLPTADVGEYLWCGVGTCGVVWVPVVWCGYLWCGYLWCGVGTCGVVWVSVVWCGYLCGVGTCGVVWIPVVWCRVLTR